MGLIDLLPQELLNKLLLSFDKLLINLLLTNTIFSNTISTNDIYQLKANCSVIEYTGYNYYYILPNNDKHGFYESTLMCGDRVMNTCGYYIDNKRVGKWYRYMDGTLEHITYYLSTGREVNAIN